MKKVKIFSLNLQEGFLLDEEIIIGAYSHHNKMIVLLCTSEYLDTCELPEPIHLYKQFFKCTDSFSITCWTNDGYKGFYEIKQMAATIN